MLQGWLWMTNQIRRVKWLYEEGLWHQCVYVGLWGCKHPWSVWERERGRLQRQLSAKMRIIVFFLCWVVRTEAGESVLHPTSHFQREHTFCVAFFTRINETVMERIVSSTQNSTHDTNKSVICHLYCCVLCCYIPILFCTTNIYYKLFFVKQARSNHMIMELYKNTSVE